MKMVRMVVMVILVSVMAYASSIASMQAPACVDFTTYTSGAFLATSFVDNGITFSSLGTGAWMINIQLGQVGLQFEDAGVMVDFPTPVTLVEMEVGVFGNLDFAVLDSSGNPVDTVTLPGDNSLHTVTLSGPDIVQVMIVGGSNEAVLYTICADFEGTPEGCVGFEEQALGTTYAVGDSFTDMGVTVLVEEFEWSTGTLTNSGIAEVQNGGMAAGTNNEIHVNNVNLHFLLPQPTTHLTLKFGEYGGNLNITIRGMFINFEDMAELDGAVINGVSVSVVNGFGGDAGTLTLDGPLADFSIGGQEFWIDELCYTSCR